VLIPGARTFVVTDEGATNIKAKVVCPISNSPVTLQAEEILAARGIVSIPDVISNSGGVIASFAQHLGANIQQTTSIIAAIITQNLDSVFANLQETEIPKKIAASIATRRINRLKESEHIEGCRFLTPWIRTLGTKSIIHGIKEYLDLKL
jgi:glutamate dehydrogenase/leucine dehydrogenase